MPVLSTDFDAVYATAVNVKIPKIFCAFTLLKKTFSITMVYETR